MFNKSCKDKKDFISSHKMIIICVIVFILLIVGSMQQKMPIETIRSVFISNESKNKVHNLGDTVVYNGLQVRINGYYTAEKENNKTKDNNIFYSINYTIRNISHVNKSISSFYMFKTIDKNNIVHLSSPQGLSELGESDFKGIITPSKRTTESYVIEAPKNSKGLKVKFCDNVDENDYITFKIN